MRTKLLLLVAAISGAAGYVHPFHGFAVREAIDFRFGQRSNGRVLSLRRLTMSATHGSIGQLSMLSVLKKLRCGDIREMKEVNFPGCINRSYKFLCENGNYFVKINDDFSAQQMFEGEAAGLKASFKPISPSTHIQGQRPYSD